MNITSPQVFVMIDLPSNLFTIHNAGNVCLLGEEKA